MDITHKAVWQVNETGYNFLDEQGNYWSHIFMDDLNADDLRFPLMLDPCSQHVFEELICF